MTAEPWVAVDQMAAHPGVTRNAIYRWIDRKNRQFVLPGEGRCRLWMVKDKRWDWIEEMLK